MNLVYSLRATPWRHDCPCIQGSPSFFLSNSNNKWTTNNLLRCWVLGTMVVICWVPIDISHQPNGEQIARTLCHNDAITYWELFNVIRTRTQTTHLHSHYFAQWMWLLPNWIIRGGNWSVCIMRHQYLNSLVLTANLYFSGGPIKIPFMWFGFMECHHTMTCQT